MTDSSELATRMQGWGIPPRALRIVLEGPRATEALGYASDFLSRYVIEDLGIVVLAGGVGVGKTIAAAWLMTQIPPPVGARRFRHVAELAEVGLYGNDDDKQTRLSLKTCKVLVLDDVGTEHMTDTYQTLFDGLMNARYEASGITVVTTNLPSDQFRSRYGERIYDRIRGRGAWYNINHGSLRGS